MQRNAKPQVIILRCRDLATEALHRWRALHVRQGRVGFKEGWHAEPAGHQDEVDDTRECGNAEQEYRRRRGQHRGISFRIREEAGFVRDAEQLQQPHFLPGVESRAFRIILVRENEHCAGAAGFSMR